MKLHCYDLSRGSGRQLKWLLGEGLKEIWHTGVVAFDKEYFFSSDTIFDTPGFLAISEAPRLFSEAKRASESLLRRDFVAERPFHEVRSLGYTFWNQDELHDFIVGELKPYLG